LIKNLAELSLSVIVLHGFTASRRQQPYKSWCWNRTFDYVNIKLTLDYYW